MWPFVSLVPRYAWVSIVLFFGIDWLSGLSSRLFWRATEREVVAEGPQSKHFLRGWIRCSFSCKMWSKGNKSCGVHVSIPTFQRAQRKIFLQESLYYYKDWSWWWVHSPFILTVRFDPIQRLQRFEETSGPRSSLSIQQGRKYLVSSSIVHSFRATGHQRERPPPDGGIDSPQPPKALAPTVRLLCFLENAAARVLAHARVQTRVAKVPAGSAWQACITSMAALGHWGELSLRGPRPSLLQIWPLHLWFLLQSSSRSPLSL
jgi:hypothetical protein